MGTVTVMSGGVFLVSGEPVGDVSALLLMSLINSVSFALATVAHMEALRHLPAGITFPLTRLSILAVILFSILFLGEQPDPFQWAGIVTGFGVVLVLARDAGSEVRPQGDLRTGLIFVAVCILCGAAAAISSKFAALATSKAAFMALSYLLGMVLSLAIERKWRRAPSSGRPATAVRLGLSMGVLNFFGFYAFLIALESGPLSVIVLITGMHFVIAIALSALIYRERLTPHRLLGLVLTVLAIFLLRI